MNYCPTDDDEVEDLLKLLTRVKREYQIEAITCGALLSDYQRIRVESVCDRLGIGVETYSLLDETRPWVRKKCSETLDSSVLLRWH